MTIRIKTRGLMSSLQAAQAIRKQVRVGIERATAQGAHELLREIKTGLRDQRPGGRDILPLSEMTLKLRRLPKKGTKAAGSGNLAKTGKTKALIVHGDLLGSINVKKVGPTHYTVGVHRGTRGRKSGKDAVNIAEIQEYGTKKYTVTVTPKMYRFSIVLMKFGILNAPWKIGSQLSRRIPERPFLRPGYNKWGETAHGNFVARLAMIEKSIIRKR